MAGYPNRTITGKFVKILRYIIVGNSGYIINPFQTQKVGSNNWNAITYGNGVYAAVGESGIVAYSNDGSIWAQVSITDASTIFRDVAYGNGKFVAVDNNGYAWTYSNGNWTKASNRPEGSINLVTVIYANGKFIASSNGGTLIFSIDGINWSKLGYVPTNTVESLVYGNGKYVAVGDMGYVAYSTDGISWTTLQINGGNFDLNSVTYGNGKFVVVGARKYLAYSTDGISWMQVPINGANFTFNSVVYLPTSGWFVAAGDQGWIINSYNGINWDTPTLLKDENGNDVTTNLNGVCIMP